MKKLATLNPTAAIARALTLSFLLIAATVCMKSAAAAGPDVGGHWKKLTDPNQAVWVEPKNPMDRQIHFTKKGTVLLYKLSVSCGSSAKRGRRTWEWASNSPIAWEIDCAEEYSTLASKTFQRQVDEIGLPPWFK